MSGNPHEEAAWALVVPSDELATPPDPAQLPPPLQVTAPLSLNTEQLPWETFERLVYAIARRIEGALDVRLYGDRGQAQEGIDLVAEFDAGPITVYQAKRYQAFSAAHLAAAVRKYAEGGRPFGATRLVIAVACEVQDTATTQMLAQLRSEFSELVIELWDRSSISELLAKERWVVGRFFGEATADAFCGTGWSEDPPTSAIDSDAVVRGPIRHLGLVDDMAAAQSELASDPAGAAGRLGEVARKLEASPFAGHAVQVRRMQAAALEAAGLSEASFLVRLDVAWLLVDSDDLWEASVLLQEMETEASLPDDLVRSARSLDAAVRLRREHSGSLDYLVDCFDEMRPEDPHRDKAAIVFSEESVAERREDLVADRTAALSEIADAQAEDLRGQMVAVRLRSCVADATGNWEQLTSEARERFDPSLAALLFARHAMYCAKHLKPEMAISRYQDAIERATAHQQHGDARSWLYSLRGVRIRYGRAGRDIHDIHRVAQALSTQGNASVFPAIDPRERALARLVEEKWPDALEALRRYRWYAVVTGEWVAETEANKMIGDVFAKTGRLREAAQHYVLAGEGKIASQVGTSLPDESVLLDPADLSRLPWQRDAMYQLVSAVADKIPDESAALWTEVALADLRGGETAGPWSNPALQAFKTFAALAPASTAHAAAEFLEYTETLIERDPGNHRFTDEAQVNALGAIARMHPALRQRALDQGMALLLTDYNLGLRVLSRLGQAFTSEVDLVQHWLAKPASEGHTLACVGLVFAEADCAPVIEHARARLAAAVARPTSEPNTISIGTGLLHDAALVSILDGDERLAFVEGMLARAEDPDEGVPNRQDALNAAQRLVATLPTELRAATFERAMAFAGGEHDGHSGGVRLPERADLLNRFQFSFGSQSLRPLGIQCAAAAASLDEDRKSVKRLAVEMLSENDEDAVHGAASALAMLPAEDLLPDVPVLSSHSSEWVRSVAAVIAAARPSEISEGIMQRLVADDSPNVRRTLARHLADQDQRTTALDELGADCRRSVRTLARPPDGLSGTTT